MPTIHREAGYRFVIYTQDHPPPHVHVKSAGCEAKIALEDGTVLRNDGFPRRELSRIVALVVRHGDLLRNGWHGVFGEKS
jgi:hypothetical protein